VLAFNIFAIRVAPSMSEEKLSKNDGRPLRHQAGVKRRTSQLRATAEVERAEAALTDSVRNLSDRTTV